MHDHDLDGVIENTTLIDKMIFSDVLDKSAKLQDMSESLKDTGIIKSDAMVFDLWSDLYKVKPKLRDKIPANLILNKSIIESLHSQPEWEGLKQICQLDELTSAIGTLKLGQKVSEILKKRKERSKNKEIENSIKKAEGLNELKDMLQSIAEQSGQNGGVNVENIINKAIQGAGIDNKTGNAILNRYKNKGLEHAISFMQQKAEKANEEVKKAAEELVENIRKDIKDAVKDAVKETESLAETLSQYRGWDDSAAVNTQINPAEAFKAADMLLNNSCNTKIKEIAKLAGRLSHAALKSKKAKTDTPVLDQWSGITEGKDISKLLPQEILALKHPALKGDFLKRFADGKLLQYEINPKQPAGNGPLVVCIDESGSMEGQREIWAKAVALALLKIARKKRRAYALIRFSNRAEEPEYIHAKKRINPSFIVNLFSGFLGGGTDFVSPLVKAFHVITKNKVYRKSDIVFITDGECSIDENYAKTFKEQKYRYKISILSVLIGPDASGVEPFSDYIYKSEAATDKDGQEVLSLFLNKENCINR